MKEKRREEKRREETKRRHRQRIKTKDRDKTIANGDFQPRITGVVSV